MDINTMDEYLYIWGQFYAFIEHYLPHPFPGIELERAAQAPMYHYSEYLDIAQKNKCFDYEQFCKITKYLPEDKEIFVPTIEKERAYFYMGLYNQREEMTKMSNGDDTA